MEGQVSGEGFFQQNPQNIRIFLKLIDISTE